MNRAQREGNAETVADDLPKAFTVTSENGKSKVYLTQLSSQTLFKRAADEEFI